MTQTPDYLQPHRGRFLDTGGGMLSTGERYLDPDDPLANDTETGLTRRGGPALPGGGDDKGSKKKKEREPKPPRGERPPKPPKARKDKPGKTGSPDVGDATIDRTQAAPVKTKARPKARKRPRAKWLAALIRSLASLGDRITKLSTPLHPFLNVVGRRLSAVARAITGLGWTMLGMAVMSWVVGAWFGWVETGLVTVFCVVVVIIAALFTIGRTRVEVTLLVSPQRVPVRQSSMASFEVTNRSGRRQRGIGLRLPVGQSVARYTVPGLGQGETYDDWLTIPTEKRGVILVGPVLTYRDDPWGLVRREVAWTDVVELFVHPEIIPLDTLGTGLLRDLEGQSTLDVSNSDLAFHALRDYAPGDDRRHIHWKSSARISAISGEDKFMVRQFLDTRKTHIAVLSDLQASHYSSDEEFELALSCAASVTVRSAMDDMDLTVLCGKQVVSRPKSNYALDAYSRAELSDRDLEAEFHRIAQFAPDASMVVLVTGATTDFQDLQRGRAIIAYNIRLLVIRVSQGSRITMRQAGGFVELTVGTLADLPRALRGGLLQ